MSAQLSNQLGNYRCSIVLTFHKHNSQNGFKFDFKRLKNSTLSEFKNEHQKVVYSAFVPIDLFSIITTSLMSRSIEPT